jgi:DNA mismatch endonuclease (patch repair protein)
MSRIKNKDTTPEIIVRKFLFSNGIRYRLHDKLLPGKPDIILPKYSTIIFVNGCFWHGHKNCKYFRIPKTRTEFWEKKINNNITRDKINTNLLMKLGWHVIEVYECELKGIRKEKTLNEILKYIKGDCLTHV